MSFSLKFYSASCTGFSDEEEIEEIGIH